MNCSFKDFLSLKYFKIKIEALYFIRFNEFIKSTESHRKEFDKSQDPFYDLKNLAVTHKLDTSDN